MSVNDVRPIEFPRIGNERGYLTFLEGGRHVPFEIRRIYYIYGVAPNEHRGAHAHRQLEQVIVALAGAFDLHLDDGRDHVTHRLDTPNIGLYVPRMLWRDLSDFSAGSVCLVLASQLYDEADYIRDYAQFMDTVRASR